MFKLLHDTGPFFHHIRKIIKLLNRYKKKQNALFTSTILDIAYISNVNFEYIPIFQHHLNTSINIMKENTRSIEIIINFIDIYNTYIYFSQNIFFFKPNNILIIRIFISLI